MTEFSIDLRFCIPRLTKMTILSPGRPPYTDLKANFVYWLAEHPAISRFRWDHDAWGSSFVFLAAAVSLYLFLLLFLKLAMKFRRKPSRLGPIPALHNLAVLLISAAILTGLCAATAVEIRETRWIRRKRSAMEWMVCFPLGTRSTGRVFFWSYVFYLSKYHELLDTFITVLRKERLTFLHVASRVGAVFSCFFCLEFSQSLQILGILTNTVMYLVVYGDFFVKGKRFPPLCTQVARNCKLVEFLLNFVGNVVVGILHLRKDGCNGIAGCVLSTGFNLFLFCLFIVYEKNLQQLKEKEE